MLGFGWAYTQGKVYVRFWLAQYTLREVCVRFWLAYIQRESC